MTELIELKRESARPQRKKKEQDDVKEDDNNTKRRQNDKSSSIGLARDPNGAEIPNVEMEVIESPVQGDKRKTEDGNDQGWLDLASRLKARRRRTTWDRGGTRDGHHGRYRLNDQTSAHDRSG